MPDNITTDQAPPGSLLDLFGPPVAVITRQDLIEDGSLIDVTIGTAVRPSSGEAGFRWPVALTASAWVDCVAWTEQDDKRKPQGTGQSESGRLWDVLFMAHQAIKRAPATVGFRSAVRLPFQVLRIPAHGKGVRPRLATLHLVMGPGDRGEPVLTIMCPDED